MIGSLVSGAIVALPNSVAALPVYEQQAPVEWTRQLMKSDVKIGGQAYLTSFKVNSTDKANSNEFLLFESVPTADRNNECIVFQSVSNAIDDRLASFIGAEVPQRQSFQREHISMVKAVASQPTDTIVADAVEFSKAIKSVEWQPLVWSDDGEIVFEWINDTKHAVVSVEGDGSIGYTMLVDGRFITGLLEHANIHSIPNDLKAYLLSA